MDHIFPSHDFPALTGVALTLPDTWRAGSGRDTLLVFFDEHSPPHFRTNITVNVTRMDGDTTVDQLAQGFAQQSLGADEFTPLGSQVIELGGHRSILQLHTFLPPGFPVPIFQAQCLVRVPTENPNAADLVEIHASCAADQAESSAPTFRGVIDSLRLSR